MVYYDVISKYTLMCFLFNPYCQSIELKSFCSFVDGESSVDMAKLTETLMAAWDRIFDGDNSGPIANVKATAASVASTIAQVAQALLDSEPSTLSSKEEKVRFYLMYQQICVYILLFFFYLRYHYYSQNVFVTLCISVSRTNFVIYRFCILYFKFLIVD